MNTDNILKYAEAGKLYKNWYQECESTLIEIFGKKELKTVTLIFAATSINSSLKSNVTLFKRAYFEHKNNLPISNYLPNIKKQLERIREGKGLSGPKINSFARAMSGDPDAVVVDIWILRAFKMNRTYYHSGSDSFREGGASKKQYEKIQRYIREEAVKMNIQPRELCAMIWSGIRSTEGGNSQTRYTDILIKDYVNCLFPLNSF